MNENTSGGHIDFYLGTLSDGGAMFESWPVADRIGYRYRQWRKLIVCATRRLDKLDGRPHLHACAYRCETCGEDPVA